MAVDDQNNLFTTGTDNPGDPTVSYVQMLPFSAAVTSGTSATVTVTRWTVGGGAEWGITPYLSLKGEVLYVDLNEHTFSTVGCGTVAREDICDDPLKIKHTFILARMALNWRFDWGKGKGPAPVVARY